MATTAVKEYDGTDTATITVKELGGILQTDLDKDIKVTPVTASSYYEDKYAGNGKSITLESNTVFTLTGAASENYILTEPVITGNITATTQTLTRARTLEREQAIH